MASTASLNNFGNSSDNLTDDGGTLPISDLRYKSTTANSESYGIASNPRSTCCPFNIAFNREDSKLPAPSITSSSCILESSNFCTSDNAAPGLRASFIAAGLKNPIPNLRPEYFAMGLLFIH